MMTLGPMPGSHEDPAIIPHVHDDILSADVHGDPDDPSSEVTHTHSHSVRLGVPEQQLVGKMDDLAGLLKQLGDVQTEQKKTWWWLKGGAGFLVFDVIVSIAGAIAIFFGSQVIDRVDRQQHNVCTLYGFVINSYNQTSRDKSPLGPTGYDDFYRQLQGAADDTQCNIPHRVK
jgi:hypothetical protein